MLDAEKKVVVTLLANDQQNAWYSAEISGCICSFIEPSYFIYYVLRVLPTAKQFRHLLMPKKSSMCFSRPRPQIFRQARPKILLLIFPFWWTTPVYVHYRIQTVCQCFICCIQIVFAICTQLLLLKTVFSIFFLLFSFSIMSIIIQGWVFIKAKYYFTY